MSALDQDRYLNAMNTYAASVNAAKNKVAEEKERQDEYNEKLQGVLEPLGAELAKKPLDDLVRDTAKKGVRKLIGQARKTGQRAASRAIAAARERLPLPGARAPTSLPPRPGRPAAIDEAGDFLQSLDDSPLTLANRFDETDPELGNVPLQQPKNISQSVTKVNTSEGPQAGQELEEGAEREAGSVTRGAETALSKAGAEGAETAGEIVAAGGGPEDPISDVIALAAGLGTLFGGLFGGHHAKIAQPPIVNPSSQFGI
jgi:hypothetical protein